MNQEFDPEAMKSGYARIAKVLEEMMDENGLITGVINVQLKSGEVIPVNLEELNTMEAWLLGRDDLQLDTTALVSTFLTYWEGMVMPQEIQNQQVESFSARTDKEGFHLEISTAENQTGWAQSYPDKNNAAWRAAALYLIAHFCEELSHVKGRFMMSWEFSVNITSKEIKFEPLGML